MNKSIFFLLLAALASSGAVGPPDSSAPAVLFPPDRAVHVNPDTHLELTFPGEPMLGSNGQIRI